MQQRSIETRDNILSAAVDLFSSKGYADSGVAAICHAAGVSKGAFYHHFSGKQALFIALLDAWLDGLEAEIEHIARTSGSVTESLLTMTGLLGGVFSQAEGRLPMFLEFWVQAARSPEVEDVLKAPYRRFRQRFAAIIQLGIDQGEFAGVDAELAASTLVSLAVGFVVQGVVDPHGGDWGQQAQQSLEMLILGFQRRRE